MTPTDHTSTLEEIFGGDFPTTKHSGGKYLKYDRNWFNATQFPIFNTEHLSGVVQKLAYWVYGPWSASLGDFLLAPAYPIEKVACACFKRPNLKVHLSARASAPQIHNQANCSKSGQLFKIRKTVHNQENCSQSGKLFTIRTTVHNQANCSQSGKLFTIRQTVHNQENCSQSGQLLTIRTTVQNQENCSQSGQLFKIRQTVHNQANCWQSGKLLTIRQTFQGREVLPICARALRCEVHAGIRTVCVTLHDFTQTKVCNLHFTAQLTLHQKDVAYKMITINI